MAIGFPRRRPSGLSGAATAGGFALALRQPAVELGPPVPQMAADLRGARTCALGAPFAEGLGRDTQLGGDLGKGEQF
jgi:hypothetical protein